MTRVKRSVAANKKRKKILKATKGYRGLRSKVYTQAKQAWMKAGLHAYEGRKLNKRNFRQLWIARISAGLSQMEGGPKYSRLIHAMTMKGIKVNRKVLADLALNHPEVFEAFVKDAMKNMELPITEHDKPKKKPAVKEAAPKKDAAPKAEKKPAAKKAPAKKKEA